MTRLSCFGCEKKNGRTVGGTFYSFHDELLTKNIATEEDNSTDNICYLGYICRPEQPLIFSTCTMEVNLTSTKVSMFLLVFKLGIILNE